ncbi:MAG: hypothetical protein GY877_09220 [Hyphomicrobium sp.]|nr:hypothetical protein [Hyphomicrobium sp.]
MRIETRILELTATLLPEHPHMRQLRAELKGLDRQTTREVKKVLAGIEKKAMIAGRRVEEVQNRHDEMRSHLSGSGDDAVSVRQYEEVAWSKWVELERLEKRLEANGARNDSGIIPLEAAMILPAQPSAVPSRKKMLPNSVLVAIAVFLIGLVLVAAKARLTASQSAARARKEASACAAHPENSAQPLLINVEAMRRVPGGSPEIALVFNTVAGLADKLRQRAPTAGGFRTLLTSETDELDPVNKAIELVKELAASGAEVMLVDWCLAGRGVAETIGAPSKPGCQKFSKGKPDSTTWLCAYLLAACISFRAAGPQHSPLRCSIPNRSISRSMRSTRRMITSSSWANMPARRICLRPSKAGSTQA